MSDELTIQIRNTKIAASEGFGAYVRKLSANAFRGGELEGCLNAYLIDIPGAFAQGSVQAVGDLMAADMELDDLCHLAYGSSGDALEETAYFSPAFTQSALLLADTQGAEQLIGNPFSQGFLLITHVSISASCRSQGVGSALVGSMARYADRAAYVALRASPFMECWDDSLFHEAQQRVKRFYSRMGFVPMGDVDSLWMLNLTSKISCP